MPVRHLSRSGRLGCCYAGTLLLVGIAVTGCARSDAGEIPTGDEPAVISPVDGSEDLHRIQLTDDAADRIGLTLTTVSAATQPSPADGARPESVAAGAIVYDSSGVTWVFVQQEHLTFQRGRVVVSRVAGDTAILRSGPPVGSQVALVGVAEIKGAEEGVPGE
jgi:hypothetical protein